MRFPGRPKRLLGDFQLVVRQVQGAYAVLAPRILPLYASLLEELRRDTMRTVRWVPREENGQADLESRQGVWDALKKWPERGRLVNLRPWDVPPRPRALARGQATLEALRSALPPTAAGSSSPPQRRVVRGRARPRRPPDRPEGQKVQPDRTASVVPGMW